MIEFNDFKTEVLLKVLHVIYFQLGEFDQNQSSPFEEEGKVTMRGVEVSWRKKKLPIKI